MPWRSSPAVCWLCPSPDKNAGSQWRTFGSCLSHMIHCHVKAITACSKCTNVGSMQEGEMLSCDTTLVLLTVQLYQLYTIYTLIHSASQQDQLDYLQYCGDVPVLFPDQETTCLVLARRSALDCPKKYSVLCEATSRQYCVCLSDWACDAFNTWASVNAKMRGQGIIGC